METKSVIYQRMKRPIKDDYELAEKYYSMLSIVNDLGLANREIQLVAFTAINGNISYKNNKEDFCKRYGSTAQTVYNMIGKLKKKRLLVQMKDKVRVNPKIVLKFDHPLKLEINMVYGEAK